MEVGPIPESRWPAQRPTLLPLFLRGTKRWCSTAAAFLTIRKEVD